MTERVARHQRQGSVSPWLIRDTWIKQQMERRMEEFTEKKQLSLFLGTWNVNAKKRMCDLNTWLKPASMRGEPDIYGIVLQEIVDLNAGSLLVDHKLWELWVQQFRICLSDKYVHICSKHLVGVLLSVFVHKDHFDHVRDILYDTVGVGVMGVGGNKGAVAIRFSIYDTSVCIVGCHMAPHKHNVQGRNQNFYDICQRVKFSQGGDTPDLNIFQHHYLFWMGDMNYRLNLDDLELTFARIEAGDLEFLLRHDQLNQERASGNVFNGFEEGHITFKPTYKYQPFTSEYERRPDKKKRLPAWCDRILWMRRKGVTLLLYERDELDMSDHKPVMAQYLVEMRVLVKEKQQKLYQELVRKLDAWENEQIPKVSMSVSQLEFPNLKFGHPSTQNLVVVNEGQTIVQFQFITKPNEELPCKKWLSIDPLFGIIPPSEYLEIQVTAEVQKDSAFALNSGQDKIDDILVMRLENGRDYFMSVTGSYKRSCLGSSLEYLVCVPTPVRTTDFDWTSKGEVENTLSLPKELWRLIDYLYRNGLDVQDLFLTSGLQQEVEQIVEDLDCGREFTEGFSVHSMAEALILFLESLNPGILPYSLFHSLREMTEIPSWIKKCLMKLPIVHYNSLIFVIAFIKELLSHSNSNHLSADKLAIIFAQCITQSPRDATEQKTRHVIKYLMSDNLS